MSHFTKRALLEIATKMIESGSPRQTGVNKVAFEKLIAAAEGEQDGAFARLSQATGTKVIHISERDTQISAQPKAVNEFVNTWSIEGFYEEGTAPAELGWGTHERRLPKTRLYAGRWSGQPDLSRPAGRPDVRAFMGARRRSDHRHGRASRRIVHDQRPPHGLGRHDRRPARHLSARPCTTRTCRATTRCSSLHELTMRNFQLQPKLRIMSDEITDGIDELGVLLMGHGLNGWWTGSQLDIHETRQLVPGQNATTLQVAASVIGGLVYMIGNPTKGILVPDQIPYKEILDVAGAYLGPCPSVQSNWTPLESRSRLFAKWGAEPVSDEDLWQFASFRLEP